MRNFLSRKPLVASNRQLHQGMIAYVGRLVVLSVFMLVLGVTSTRAQTGQDERCASYSGQAHGLCTSAVAAGCFDGVVSQACDTLSINWEEGCNVCEGTPPWGEATCPTLGLNAAITRQIESVDEETLLIELVTVTTQPYEPVVTSLTLPPTCALVGPPTTTSCVVNRGNFRCRHEATVDLTPSCTGDGDYTMSFQLTCATEVECPLCGTTVTVPFSLTVN
jgi:hypothetical protein